MSASDSPAPQEPSFDIRPARAEDVPAVVELMRALARFEKLEGPDEAAAARLAADFARGDRFRLLVAEEAGRVIAYALYFFAYSTFLARPTLYLEDLFVDEASRGRGLGEALLRRLGREAVESGCGRFEWTVLDWNVNAQRFYLRMGARILPAWRICRVEGDAIAKLAAEKSV